MNAKACALLAASALLLAACGGQRGPSQAQQHGGVPAATPSQAAGVAEAAPSMSRVANAPDQGALMRYPAGNSPVQRDGYFAYPIDLSEAHARNATGPGKGMSIDLPDGKQVHVSYSRDVHHPDGSWSWVGTARDGSQVLMTFGADAVFGYITVPTGGQYEINMLDGKPWLTRPDPARLRDANAAPRASESDMLVPQLKAAASKSPVVQQASLGVTAAAATIPVIDVVLGYSTGFLNAQGGPSQASTRLTYLLEVGNQALANSLISAKFRLLHVQKIDYDDASTNETALNDLTSGTSALSALRTWRDTVGADLVGFVRANRAEQQNCGIAWVIGGNGQTISNAWANNGFAVISDGRYQSGNYIYYCRDVTLVHEFGHNLGQVHDQADSSSQGAHPYSYGYRQDSTTGFYTVMAYSLASTQVSIPYFANPSVNYNGAPTGIANTNDNARSMAQTIPLIIQFRNAVTPFADVPTDYWSFEYIRRLYDGAVTNGCATNPLSYCAGDAVPRDQMAVFLVRAGHGAGYQPPAATGMFTDVPANYWAAPWIEQLYRDGVTNGCTTDQKYFCPTSSVSREQMALFLLRGKHGASYVPPPPTGLFNDVPTSSYTAAWIEQLANEGTTSGCSVAPPLYCPADSVTRDQMAVFLVRNYGL